MDSYLHRLAAKKWGKRPMNRRRRLWKLLALVWTGAAINGWAVSPLLISSTQPLAFGKFAAGPGGAVTVNPSGGRSASGGVVLVSAGGGSAAQFTVSGDPSASYSISLPTNGTVALVNGGGQGMAVNGFSSSPNTAGQLSPVGGTQTIVVGATLSVGPNQPPGSYSASFNVSVDYN